MRELTVETSEDMVVHFRLTEKGQVCYSIFHPLTSWLTKFKVSPLENKILGKTQEIINQNKESRTFWMVIKTVDRLGISEQVSEDKVEG